MVDPVITKKTGRCEKAVMITAFDHGETVTLVEAEDGHMDWVSAPFDTAPEGYLDTDVMEAEKVSVSRFFKMCKVTRVEQKYHGRHEKPASWFEKEMLATSFKGKVRYNCKTRSI